MRPVFRTLGVLFLVVFGIVCLQGQQFQFAWLSDTHVGSSTGAADLTASVHDINSLGDIAFVILSGDVTEMGSNKQLELAKAILDSLRKPYYIIPGNHDTKWSESGCTEFGKLWGNDKFAFDFAGFRFIGMHEGPIMKMGDGHVPPEDLRWLDSVLAKTPRNDKPLFFITHYPLDSSIDNWYQVTERLKLYNTQAVLVGHGHRNRVLSFEGLPGIMGRSNLRSADSIGGYTLVTIQRDTVYFSERLPWIRTGRPWHQLPLGHRNYRSDTTRHPRPEFSINRHYPQARVVWEKDTRYTIASSPAVWNDLAIVGNSSGVVYAFSLDDGSDRWRFATGSAVYSTPDVTDGKVVLGSSDHFIYCLDAENGRLVWKYRTGAPVVATPKIEDRLVFVGGSDSTFRALDLRSGKLKWEFKGIGGFIETRPKVYQDRVIFGAWDTHLYALQVDDGSLAWKWSSDRPGVLYSPAACWPVAAQGKVFIAAPDRYLTAIDVTSGATVWRSNRYQVRETVGLAENASRVYARCMIDTVIAFSPSSPKLDVLWARDCGYGYDIDPSMPIEKDGDLFFATKNGFVVALDAASGDLLWKHRMGVTIVHTPVLLDAHRVVACDLDGKVMLLEADEQ
jgi:outer membrane protein assembly factor BamB/predicted phosphohydrolase